MRAATRIIWAAVAEHRDDAYWLCATCRRSLEAVPVRPQPSSAPATCDRCGGDR